MHSRKPRYRCIESNAIYDPRLSGIASCGVAAEKTGAALEKYNRASRLAAAVADTWRRETGGDAAHLAAVVRSQPDAADRLRAILVPFTPDFEILPGTAPKQAAAAPKPFEVRDLVNPMLGD